MKTALPCALGALLTALFSSQALACYTVYNRANQVVYHAAAAPVDMRYQIHQTLPAVFPGGHLVFSVADTNCPPVNISTLSSQTSYPADRSTKSRDIGSDTVIRR